MSVSEKSRNSFVATLTIFGIFAVSFGLGAAFGWPFALLAVGVVAILIAIAAS